jgi:ubiquinone/menaquinone biosynthesis C-methylase UbiE
MRGILASFLLDRFARNYARRTGERRARLFATAAGRTLEIGAGTGANLAFLPRGLDWTGLDPNPHGARYARSAAECAGCGFHYVTGRSEALPYADGDFDTVIATLTLCSVTDPVAVVEEIRRVLRPGGSFYFMEHVAAEPGTAQRRRQQLARPWFRALAGCTPDRETGQLLRAAHFRELQLERFAVDLPIVAPHICGVAWR